MAKRDDSGETFGAGWWGCSKAGPSKLDTCASSSNSKLQLPACNHCHKKSYSLKTCTRCQQAKYCDRQCQRKDFKAHKVICKSVQLPCITSLQLTESLKQARVVRESMGGYEMDISFNGEADLDQNYVQCQKNPGHTNFIPARRFSVKDLPDGWKQEAIVNSISKLAAKTVKLVCRWVSNDRPRGAYLYNVKGRKFTRVASGYVFTITKKSVSDGFESCRCKLCVTSGVPKTCWYEVSLLTAKHTVYDKSEAEQTVVHVGYDDDRCRDRVRKLIPYNIVYTSELNLDMIVLYCAAHELPPSLQKMNERIPAELLVQPPAIGPRLVVIVSHPHGCCKVVSLGWLKNEKRVDVFTGHVKISYTYDTPTCPGTSGAPVWVVSSHQTYRRPPHHCRYAGGGVNESGEFTFCVAALSKDEAGEMRDTAFHAKASGEIGLTLNNETDRAEGPGNFLGQQSEDTKPLLHSDASASSLTSVSSSSSSSPSISSTVETSPTSHSMPDAICTPAAREAYEAMTSLNAVLQVLIESLSRMKEVLENPILDRDAAKEEKSKIQQKCQGLDKALKKAEKRFADALHKLFPSFLARNEDGQPYLSGDCDDALTEKSVETHRLFAQVSELFTWVARYDDDISKMGFTLARLKRLT